MKDEKEKKNQQNKNNKMKLRNDLSKKSRQHNNKNYDN